MREGEASGGDVSDPAEDPGGGSAGGKAETATPGHIDEVRAPGEKDEDADPLGELEALRDRHLRLAAEFDNFRRRTRREMSTAGEAARASLAGTLLDVVDDLQRVADTPHGDTTVEALHEGTVLVSRKLAKALAGAGVERVDPAGEPFDPTLHEALMMTPTDDPDQDETVSQVIMAGYRLGSRLLRPARVIVFRYGEEAE